ncbi:MAG TPA: mandelate racemase/muconate lactonizing enzyme family protein [Gammaproteobacteria bacterium]|nr:mandelate racemase/muconate lactonizing enzyme family protein [Gammaproteobacteria bacterium]
MLTDIKNVVVTSIEIKPIAIPLSKPFSNHLRIINKIDGIVCLVHTNVGVSGQGLVYGLGEINHNKAIDGVNCLVPKIINKPIVTPKQISDIMFDDKSSFSFELHNVISAIDIAIWDIYLKEKNIPLHKIFCFSRSSISVYDTAGWLSLSEQELIDACQRNAAQGIGAFKVRLGDKSDRDRIANLRKAMGNEFTLMADANQRFNVNEALKLIRDLAEFNLIWIEEPVGQPLSDLKQVAEQSLIPIAVGENIKSKNIFKEICDNKLASYLQPDIRSCMGLTGFIEVCQLAHVYNVPICNHLMPELSSSLIAGSPNGFLVEYLDIIPPNCFTHDFSIKDGKIYVPNMSGTGVELTREAIQKFSV